MGQGLDMTVQRMSNHMFDLGEIWGRTLSATLELALLYDKNFRET